MRNDLRFLIAVLAAVFFLAGCQPRAAATSEPVPTIAVVQPTASPTRAQSATASPSQTLAAAATPVPTPTLNATATASRKETQDATNRMLLTMAAQTAQAATSTPLPTERPQSDLLLEPFGAFYGRLQTYRYGEYNLQSAAWLLPDLQEVDPLALDSLEQKTVLHWDNYNSRTYSWMQRLAKIEHDSETSRCLVWVDGDWVEVFRMNITDISYLAESVEGRQQAWVQDCARSPDGKTVALNILGGGTQWFDRSVIYTINVDGSSLSRRTPSVYGTVYMHLFSHPYLPIFFYDDQDGVYHGYNIETNRRWTLTGSLLPFWMSASVSPDGRWFTFLATDSAGKTGVYFTDIFADNPPVKISISEELQLVHWSPDGIHLLGETWISPEKTGLVFYEVAFKDGIPQKFIVKEIKLTLQRLEESIIWVPWFSNVEGSPVCNDSLVSYLAPGDYAFVNPQFKGVLQYRQGADGPLLGSLSPYQQVIVLSGPTCLGNKIWWEVYMPTIQKKGWVIEMDGGEQRLVPLIPPDGRPAPLAAASTASSTQPGEATSTPAQDALVCPGAPPTQLRVGMQAMVSTATTTPNRLRVAPSTGSEQVGFLAPGTLMDVVAGPECANNYTWWKVTALVNGVNLTGWTVEGDKTSYWLVPAP